MLQALKQLGCEIKKSAEVVEISPMKRTHQDLTIDVGLAGTVMRFVPPLAALSTGVAHFDGEVNGYLVVIWMYNEYAFAMLTATPKKE